MGREFVNEADQSPLEVAWAENWSAAHTTQFLDILKFAAKAEDPAPALKSARGAEKMGCIYCGKHEADAREHYLPQCLGRFQNFEPLLGKLCQECNEGIGGKLEREFCRRSPEAVLPSVNWVKGQHKKRQAHLYQPEKIGGQHLYFFAPDPETGESILWQPGKEPRTVKEISQLVIYDDAGEVTQQIPIPVEMTTGRELVELFKAYSVRSPVPKVKAIAASGDEERVQRLLSAINVNAPMQRRVGGLVAKQSSPA